MNLIIILSFFALFCFTVYCTRKQRLNNMDHDFGPDEEKRFFETEVVDNPTTITWKETNGITRILHTDQETKNWFDGLSRQHRRKITRDLSAGKTVLINNCYYGLNPVEKQ